MTNDEAEDGDILREGKNPICARDNKHSVGSLRDENARDTNEAWIARASNLDRGAVQIHAQNSFSSGERRVGAKKFGGIVDPQECERGVQGELGLLGGDRDTTTRATDGRAGGGGTGGGGISLDEQCAVTNAGMQGVVRRDAGAWRKR